MNVEKQDCLHSNLIWIKSSYSDSEGAECVEVAWRRSTYSDNEGGECVEVGWRKSRHSDAEGNNCVEVGWRKSSHSDNEGGNCLEVADATAVVHIRDSKAPQGPTLTVPRKGWAAFLQYATKG